MCSADEFQVVDVDKLQRKKARQNGEGLSSSCRAALPQHCVGSAMGPAALTALTDTGCAKDTPYAPGTALLPPATCKDPPVPSTPSSTHRAGTELTVLGANLSSQSTERAPLGFEM